MLIDNTAKLTIDTQVKAIYDRITLWAQIGTHSKYSM